MKECGGYRDYFSSSFLPRPFLFFIKNKMIGPSARLRKRSMMVPGIIPTSTLEPKSGGDGTWAGADFPMIVDHSLGEREAVPLLSIVFIHQIYFYILCAYKGSRWLVTTKKEKKAIENGLGLSFFFLYFLLALVSPSKSKSMMRLFVSAETSRSKGWNGKKK